jgi:hypothetical protein
MGKRTAKAAAPAIEYRSKEEAGITRERGSVIFDREYDKLLKRHGAVTPEMIVEVASNEASPLHSLFIWDDAEAARRQRLDRAMDLMIRSKIQIVLNQKPGIPSVIGLGASHANVRRLLPSQHGSGKFKFRKDVLDDADARKELIERRLGVLRSWCRENIDIEELTALREAIIQLLPGE